jgi:S1-C subfamily serine protease
MKQLRSERDSSPAQPNGADYLTSGVSATNGNGVEEMPFEMEDGRTLSRVPTAADTVEWQATIEKVVKSVVAIHFCQTYSFDTDTAVSSEATGFVVDAERGYILTNRVWTTKHSSSQRKY